MEVKDFSDATKANDLLTKSSFCAALGITQYANSANGGEPPLKRASQIPLNKRMRLGKVHIQTITGSNTSYLAVDAVDIETNTTYQLSVRALLSCPDSTEGFVCENGTVLHCDTTKEDLKVTFSNPSNHSKFGITLPVNNWVKMVIMLENEAFSLEGKMVEFCGKAGRTWKARKAGVKMYGPAKGNGDRTYFTATGDNCAALTGFYHFD